MIKKCPICIQLSKTNVKREPSGQIITYYPKQRIVMDLTELSDEIEIDNKKGYLFNLVDHFSKYGLSFLIFNKEANTIFIYLEQALDIMRYPEEIGSDNENEFKNNLIENFLKDNDIKFIHGRPFSPHSQGVVERFHQTLKDMLYCFYI